MARGGLQRRPAGVRRRAVSASALLILAVLLGVFAFADELRHPVSGDGELADPEVIGDPRDEVTCPEPEDVVRAADDAPMAVSSDDLLDCPRSYDGQRVRYVGEPVGEVLVRRDHAWVQLNDDVYSATAPLPLRPDYAGANTGVGARLPAGAADDIDHVGGPDRRGDHVVVEGRFHRALPGSADAMVIDADRLQPMRSGGPIDQRVLPDRQVAATALGVLAVAMVVAERLVTRRR